MSLRDGRPDLTSRSARDKKRKRKRKGNCRITAEFPRRLAWNSQLTTAAIARGTQCADSPSGGGWGRGRGDATLQFQSRRSCGTAVAVGSRPRGRPRLGDTRGSGGGGGRPGWGQINPRDYCHTVQAPHGPFSARSQKKKRKKKTRGRGLTSNLFLIERRLQRQGGR